MHSEFACEVIVQSDHDHSTLEITFWSAQNLFFSHHRIKNCSTLEIGVQCIQNLHVNSQYSQIMTTLPQKLLFTVHRNIIRYFHFGPMEKPMNQITAIFVDHDVLYKISLGLLLCTLIFENQGLLQILEKFQFLQTRIFLRSPP